MITDDLNDTELTISDEESRAAMRAFLQRSEVRLSTIHRVGQALLGGSALVLLLPLFLRDAFPQMMTVLIASYDAGQPRLPIIAIGIAVTLVDWADAKIHIASHVIHYGSAVFEGARCYDTPRGSACFWIVPTASAAVIAEGALW